MRAAWRPAGPGVPASCGTRRRRGLSRRYLGSLWGHRETERTHFFEPARDLVDQAINAGVERFLPASTLVVGQPGDDQFSLRGPTGFWPHLDRLIELETYLADNSHRGTRMISIAHG